MNGSDDFLRYLRQRFGCGACPRALIVAAHPDDEIIGAGAALAALPDSWVVHVTDGAPRRFDSAQAGFGGRSAYEARRSVEARAALKLAGVNAERIFELGLTDQESAFHLVELARRMYEVVLDIRPDLIFVHPYEGGHPDHDAAAFATHAVVVKSISAGRSPLKLVEFTSYHAGPQGMEVGRFRGENEYTLHLSESARELKAEMFSCHGTQREVLQMFPVDAERFRAAPRYNFNELPRPLYYQRFDWGMTGERWLELVGAAAEELAPALIQKPLP